MKKLLYLLPLLLGVFACGAQVPSTPSVADIVNATLTSLAQNNPQGITPQTANTPSSIEVQPTVIQSQPLPSDSTAPTGNITYFWPRNLPEGFALSRETSFANSDGFALAFINPSSGAINLLGGTEVNQFQSCEPVTVRGLEGCFPPGTGGGSAVQWKENYTYYAVGVMSLPKELTLSIAEQLESIDLPTFLARLAQ